MSVDSLMEIFTGHSPYHYSYNNPVMFSDPSGLAPEGEKDNKVQAPGDDAIGGSITSGYWTTRVSYSYNEYYTKNLDDPMGPRGRTFHSDLVVSTEDVFVNGSGGGGGGGGGVAPSASRTGSINRSTSRKVYKTSLDKSMRDQNYVMRGHMGINLEMLLLMKLGFVLVVKIITIVLM